MERLHKKTLKVGAKKVSCGSLWKRALKVLPGFIFFLAFLFVGGVVFLSMKGKAEGKIPSIGRYQMMSVTGRSMEPAIKRGSAIFVKRPKDFGLLEIGDVITFISPADKKTIVTHRIAEVRNKNGEFSFVTRGDANAVNDIDAVPEEYIIGQVNFALPYVGFLMDFAKTGVGLLLLVVVPGGLIIIIETLNLFRELASYRRRKREMLLERLRESLLSESAQGGNELGG